MSALESVRESLSPFYNFISSECVHVFQRNPSKLFKPGPLTLMTFSRSWEQISRSCSDDHGNFENSITREPLKKFKPNLHKHLLHSRDEVITFSKSEVKVRQRSNQDQSK